MITRRELLARRRRKRQRRLTMTYGAPARTRELEAFRRELKRL